MPSDNKIRLHKGLSKEQVKALAVATLEDLVLKDPDHPEVGDRMADGSVFAGFTTDGKQQIYAMPAADLNVTMTFNDAAKAVNKLNNNKAFGHDDWQSPNLETLRVLYKNKDKGALKGTFMKEAGKDSDYPGWYWSSTECRDLSSHVRIVRFSDGYENWIRKDTNRLSCRPVRLVSADAPRPSAPRAF